MTSLFRLPEGIQNASLAEAGFREAYQHENKEGLVFRVLQFRSLGLGGSGIRAWGLELV